MSNNHKKLHLGCGSVNFSGWLNIDLDSPTADMQLDLTRPLPFDDCSITHIFTEHFIEHISRPVAVNFLVGCRRILSANGVIRIITPNLRFLIASYLAANKDAWGELWQPDTLCLMVNEGMRSWGHQFVYDVDELVRVLVEAGFNSISCQEYQKSQDKELCGLETRPFHNDLIVEARKTENPIQFIDCQAFKHNEDRWPIKLNNELVARFKTAEQTIADQATHIRNVEAEWTARGEHIAALEQTIADQTTHIRNVEVDWTARGQHIAALEQTIADQTTHIRNVEVDWTARGQHIAALEQTIADQTTHIRNVEVDWTARGQHIAALEQAIDDQVSHIHAIEAALMKFHNSLYGKCISGLSSLFSLMRNKRTLP